MATAVAQAKATYRVRNWAKYNESLGRSSRRGSTRRSSSMEMRRPIRSIATNASVKPGVTAARRGRSRSATIVEV